MNKERSVYIINALRSPVGKLHGSLSSLRPDDLLSKLLEALVAAPGFQPEQLEAISIGCGNQAGEDNRNIARMGVLLSGLPTHVYASTINSLCASGLEAVLHSARALLLGEGDLYLAGGVDSMSRSPWVESRVDGERVDSTIGWRFVNPRMQAHYAPHSMPKTAELLAQRRQISRQAQDTYAQLSRERFEQARLAGLWKEEIVPIYDQHDAVVLAEDEQHRLLSMELLGQLPPMLKDGEFVTLGNAARVGDGAAVLALASAAYVRQHNVEPLAQLHSFATSAEHPDYMGLAPVSALRKVLRRSGLRLEELDIVELGESFAVQVLAGQQALGIPLSKLNRWGGGISMGNPLGMGGARLLVSLVHALARGEGRWAAGAVCAGLGLGVAVVLKKC